MPTSSAVVLLSLRAPFGCLCIHAFKGFASSLGSTIPRTLRQQISLGGGTTLRAFGLEQKPRLALCAEVRSWQRRKMPVIVCSPQHCARTAVVNNAAKGYCRTRRARGALPKDTSGTRCLDSIEALTLGHSLESARAWSILLHYNRCPCSL